MNTYSPSLHLRLTLKEPQKKGGHTNEHTRKRKGSILEVEKNDEKGNFVYYFVYFFLSTNCSQPLNDLSLCWLLLIRLWPV